MFHGCVGIDGLGLEGFAIYVSVLFGRLCLFEFLFVLVLVFNLCLRVVWVCHPRFLSFGSHYEWCSVYFGNLGFHFVLTATFWVWMQFLIETLTQGLSFEVLHVYGCVWICVWNPHLGFVVHGLSVHGFIFTILLCNCYTLDFVIFERKIL